MRAVIPFATEFPVHVTVDRASFVAVVVAWLRGTTYSEVLEHRRETDLENHTAFLKAENGEELRLREFGNAENLEAIGFRHDFPDKQGRLWRTEAVVKRGRVDHDDALIRLRTQCIARQSGARLEQPNKPYLIKAILADGWGGTDGLLSVSDQPVWITDDSSGLELARLATKGDATRHLPVIYVSATGPSRWHLTSAEIDKLAYNLGGVAHVIAEPDRGFSFRLREATQDSNAYGGALGVIVPGQGIVRRLMLGWQLEDSFHLAGAARDASIYMRSQMPSVGWDWTELQEQALRQQRQRDRNRLSAQETEDLFQEEVDNLQDRVRQLEEQLAAKPLVEPRFGDESGPFTNALADRIGREIYAGEYSDRLRWASQTLCAMAEQISLDQRSAAIFGRIAESLPVSAGLRELQDDLRRATKDTKRVSSELGALLIRHGYRTKAANKHVRLEAGEEYDGLDAITLPKTPSDNRGLTNLRKQIERTLGIAKLSSD